MSPYETDTYEYRTNQHIDTLIKQINSLSKYNLTGYLNKDNSFVLVQNISLISIDFIDRHPVTIDGKLYYISENESKIKISLRPNFIFVLFSALFGGAGVVVFLKSLLTSNVEFGAFIFILAAPILALVAVYSKAAHKKRFEKASKLKMNH